MLNDIDDFIAVCVTNSGVFTNYLMGETLPEPFEAGDIHCPGCGAPRRVRLWQASPGRFPLRVGRNLVPLGLDVSDPSAAAIARQLAPLVLTGACLQDGTTFTFVLFQGPDRFELAVFPNKRGGLSTPHTPPSVAYYLDQAQRAQSTAANSAAVAMYRAALEHLLYEQGFTDGMLGAKTAALERKVADGTAPRWAQNLNTAYLTVIGRLGNAAIHPGDGDIRRQDAIDRGLLTQLEITFSELLRIAYEQQHEEAANLAALNAALDSLK